MRKIREKKIDIEKGNKKKEKAKEVEEETSVKRNA